MRFLSTSRLTVGRLVQAGEVAPACTTTGREPIEGSVAERKNPAVPRRGRGLIRAASCAVVFALVFAALLVSPEKSLATDYVLGCDAESITLDHPVHPGQTIKLPSFNLHNKGTKAAQYQMKVVADGATKRMDAEWVVFSPSSLALDPQEAGRVEVTIKIPRDAELGTYRALLAGRLVSQAAGDVQMSIGVGPMLTMEVTRGSWVSTAKGAVGSFFTNNSPWWYFACLAVVLLAAAALTAVRRRKSRVGAISG